MNNQFSEENIDLIQQYIAGELSADAKTDFENQLQADKDLQKLVADYRLMQEGFELTELQKKRNRLKNIKTLAQEEITVKEEATIREIKRVPYQKILSYAAMLIPGLLLGWLFFNNQENQSNNGNYGGNLEDAVVLYDQATPLLKISQQEKNNLITDTLEINLIISELENPETFYTLEGQNLEVIINKELIANNNLSATPIYVILQKLNQPKIEVALLKINQRTFQIPLSNQDFNALFN